jgi:hypothetical protein
VAKTVNAQLTATRGWNSVATARKYTGIKESSARMISIAVYKDYLSAIARRMIDVKLALYPLIVDQSGMTSDDIIS